jgi:tetratricopeptide (TPR) repeat protein/predicted Ser/Thr protein kinase
MFGSLLGRSIPARSDPLKKGGDGDQALPDTAGALLPPDPPQGPGAHRLTAERWSEIERVFFDALEREPADRGAFLDQACTGDEALRRRVEALLAADEHVAKEGLVAPPAPDAPPHPRQPVPGQRWDRFEVIECLGEGGMGRVYKARDPGLNRLVALKVLRSDRPELRQRFSREARAVAKVEHDHICKVYEVGEVDGLPFIVMQYVEGAPLSKAGAWLKLEQKVRVVERVAEALHAAHRMGVIHRDVKPANILVEQTDEGEWRPYVTDFGIAREIEADGHTLAGTVLGTPAYMAPEQARGELDKLDRRTDVYGVGATLYELLAGRAPFAGLSGLDVVQKVIQEEPAGLGAVDRRIPADLETIVMKCLEKEPGQRYDSARALAEDLERFLDGEPIQARRTSLAYRLARKARKHAAAVALSGVALSLVLTFAALGAHARWTASEQTRLAQRFALEANEIESILRRAEMLPLHDVRPEKALLRERMRSMETEMRRLGRLAEGPGHHALGEGSLALGDAPAARRHLERAWTIGYRPPEVEHALGRALGGIYSIALEDVDRTSDKTLRELRRSVLDHELRAPALRCLQAPGRSGVESPLLMEGLIAFYGKRYQDALEKARRAFQETAWLHEAKRLEGDILVEQGIEEHEKGEHAKAAALYSQAGEAYGAAIEIARSARASYESDARRWYWVMTLQMAQGADPKEARDRALAASDLALKVDPDDPRLHDTRASIHLRWAEQQALRGEDARAALERAEAAAQEALRLVPRDEIAHYVIGMINLKRGETESAKGGDPLPWLDRSVESHHRAIEANPSFVKSHIGLGLVYWRRGQHESGQGLDPRPSLQSAVESFQRAAEVTPSYGLLYSNLGYVYKMIATYESERGLDATPAFTRSVETLQKALALNPSYAGAYANLGSVLATKGSHEAETGIDPEPSLNAAVAALRKGIEANPSLFLLHTNLGFTYVLKAESELEVGRDCHGTVSQALESYSKAVALNPKYAWAYADQARAHLARARFLIAERRDPGADLKKAELLLSDARKMNPNDFWSHLYQGQVELAAGRWALIDGRDPSGLFKRSQASFEAARRLNPRSVVAHEAIAELCRWRADSAVRKKASPRRDLDEGVEAAGQALSINPRRARALAIMGVLHLLQGDSEAGRDGRAEAARRAQDCLERAMAINARLRGDYEASLSEARRRVKEIAAGT